MFRTGQLQLFLTNLNSYYSLSPICSSTPAVIDCSRTFLTKLATVFRSREILALYNLFNILIRALLLKTAGGISGWHSWMYTSSQHLIIWASKVKSVKNKEIKNLDFANSMIHLRNKGKNIYFYHLKIEKKYDANKIY